MKKKNEVEEAPLGDELMIFEPDSSRFFVLNPSMSLVWKNIEQLDEADMAELVSSSFEDVDTERASSDVREAIRQLETMGLVEREKVHG